MFSTKTLSIAPALILAVSLTACSDLLTELDSTSLAGAGPKAASPAVAKSEVTHPDLPPNLIACATATNLKAPSKIVDAAKAKEPAKGAAASADAKVVALQQQAEARRSCAIAIVGWYRKLQEATKKADPKTADATPIPK